MVRPRRRRRGSSPRAKRTITLLDDLLSFDCVRASASGQIVGCCRLLLARCIICRIHAGTHASADNTHTASNKGVKQISTTRWMKKLYNLQLSPHAASQQPHFSLSVRALFAFGESRISLACNPCASIVSVLWCRARREELFRALPIHYAPP
jgi:hypothetical protein